MEDRQNIDKFTFINTFRVLHPRLIKHAIMRNIYFLSKGLLFFGLILLIGQTYAGDSYRIHDIRLDRFFGGSLAQSQTEYYVHGELAFIGSGMLESLYMHYQVNGDDVHTTFFDDINLNAQIPFYYEADEHWVPDQEGDYHMAVWFSGLNGAPIDEGVSDTLLVEVSVYDYLPERELVMLESFSSQNCGSCAIVNPGIRAMINNNPESYSMIFYHPLSYENSPLYLFNPRDNDTRRGFYGVNFTPLSVIGGLFFGSSEFVDEDLMDLEMMKPAAFAIEATYHLDGDHVHVDVEGTSYAHFHDRDLRLLISLTEDEVHFDEPPGSNGEQSFYHVMRAFIPGAEGIQLGDMDVGSEFFAGPEVQLDFSVIDSTGIQLHAFIQDFESREIYQVTRLTYEEPADDDNGDDNGDDDNGDDNGDDGDDDNGDDDNGDGDETSVTSPDDKGELLIYPNPADNVLFVSMEESRTVKNIRIFDLRGREVMHERPGSSDTNQVFRLHTSTLDPGLYILVLDTDTGTLQQKVSVTR